MTNKVQDTILFKKMFNKTGINILREFISLF